VIDRASSRRGAHHLGLETDDEEAKAPGHGETANGTTKIPRDGLAANELEHWIVIDEFSLGSTTFRCHGPFMFCRPRQYPGWLIAHALDQNFGAEFKGKKKGR